MPSRFRHAALVGKYQSRDIRHVVEEIAQFLSRQGLEVTLESETARATGLADYDAMEPAGLGRHCDLAVVVGGDGTMLGFARQIAPYGIPLVGINQGRLGFVTDVPIRSYKESLEPMLAGDYEVEHRSILEGDVWRDGLSIFHGLAMNEVVASRGTSAGMVEMRIDIGEEFVANLRADGVILSSPTGSTAYALSAGGPILHPGLAGWVLVPIAPHTLSARPIVLPDTAPVSIEVVAGRDASVSFDAHHLASLLHRDRIVVRRSAHQARFLHPRGWSYYATLRRKLHWQEGAVG
jgi:NAD+ kinase